MRLSQSPRQPWPLRLAIVASLVLHGVVLFLAPEPPERRFTGAPSDRLPKRLDATLAPRKAQAPAAARQTPQAPPKPTPAPPKPPAATAAKKPSPPKPAEERRKILAMPKQGGATASTPTPKWSVQQKQEMDQFLGELDAQAKAEAKARPSLAERSLATAREFGRKEGRPEDDGVQIVERIPGSPPIEPFSLEMYFDSLLKKLNRSAQFVRDDPRTQGVRKAQVVIRINPSGALRTFDVLEAGDQQDQIEFIRAVVNRAVPFAAFPPDIVRSAQSLALVICIRPAGSGDGGFGFTRMPSGRNC